MSYFIIKHEENHSVFNKWLPFHSFECAGRSALHMGTSTCRGSPRLMEPDLGGRGVSVGVGMALEHFSGLSTSCCR